jgi:hypothetical protein
MYRMKWSHPPLIQEVGRGIFQCLDSEVRFISSICMECPKAEALDPGEDIERGKQSGRAISDITVGHGSAFAGLEWQAGLGAI